MRNLIALTCLSGCGTSLWVMTPRSDVTYQELPRTSTVAVTTRPAGLTLLVDGAEAGVSPRAIPIAHRELRRQRKKSTWPAIIGTAIDIAATSILMLAAGDEGGPGPALFIGGIGAGVVTLDLHLITTRSAVDESIEAFPVTTRIGVETPYGPVERTIRVPDVDHLDLDFQAPGWMVLPQGAMETPSQPAGNGTTAMPPSLSSNAPGS